MRHVPRDAVTVLGLKTKRGTLEVENAIVQ